jgi:hypothetical protein
MKIARAKQEVVRPETSPKKRDVRGTGLRKYRKPLNESVRIWGPSSSADFDSRHGGNREKWVS